MPGLWSQQVTMGASVPHLFPILHSLSSLGIRNGEHFPEEVTEEEETGREAGFVFSVRM